MNNDDLQIIDKLISQAANAQRLVEKYSQDQIDDVCRAVAWETWRDENVAKCARIAVDETKMGTVEDKMTKHKVKVLGVIDDVLKGRSVGLIEEDKVKGIRKYAKPVGVVGAVTPVTNPTTTLACDAVAVLKGRNAIVFAPHPRAKRSCALVCDMMRQGLEKVGAPKDLIQYIPEPSVPLTQELMRRSDLVLATGGAHMVTAAYSSGRPAYGVGAGNPAIIVAEDADIGDAAKKIAASKTFDNATSCSAENSLIVHHSVYESMLAALKQEGGHLCSPDERTKLKNWLWVPHKTTGKLTLNIQAVAQNARKIANDAGLDVSADTRFLIVEGEALGEDLFCGERLCPVITCWRYDSFDEALKTRENLANFAGQGHSCGIHTFNESYINRLAETAKTSRIMVRQPQALANTGNTYNGMPYTMTLGCGTWGGNITTENITWRHFINVTWVSEPIQPVCPNPEEIWKDQMNAKNDAPR